MRRPAHFALDALERNLAPSPRLVRIFDASAVPGRFGAVVDPAAGAVPGRF
ncbi:MAG: hypothetical protein JNJ54_19345 [Myxococcaceae bacterium]|nr:hypothetical protein [Myxococcaceae bacterium]